jgi:hypothetical protein
VKKPYLWIFVVLLATYIVLAFALPPDPQILSKHHLTATSVRLLNLSVIGPLTLVYLAALYGFLRVDDYANKVRNTKEGPHFKKLATGLTILALSLPLNGILGSLASYARHAQPHWSAELAISRNYIALALAAAAIILISKGARGLYGTLKRQDINGRSVYALIGPIILASIYTWLIVAQGSGNPDGPPYYLPEWLIVTTIAIPYVFIWCVGAWAAVHLYYYHNGVKGSIYKRAMNNLAKGVGAIIIISILLQFLTTLSGILNRLDLTPLLLVIYLLVGAYAVGYGLVARGAKKLKQIEEV